MNYLLDTNCLIWFQENNSKIPVRIMDIIQDNANEIFFSQISLIEISIKLKLGKLPEFLIDVEDFYKQALKDNFIYLSIQNNHIYNYQNIPLLEEHRDPFDRLIIATAFIEKTIILTPDKKFKLYPTLVKADW